MVLEDQICVNKLQFVYFSFSFTFSWYWKIFLLVIFKAIPVFLKKFNIHKIQKISRKLLNDSWVVSHWKSPRLHTALVVCFYIGFYDCNCHLKCAYMDVEWGCCICIEYCVCMRRHTDKHEWLLTSTGSQFSFDRVTITNKLANFQQKILTKLCNFFQHHEFAE